jgi:hypothetical protein
MKETLPIRMERTTVYEIETPFVRKRNVVVGVHMGMKGEIPHK